MTDRTWIGGSGSNNAATPKNWSPTGVPQAGETLQMNSGTLNATGNVLQGDKLLVGMGVLNQPGSDITVNLKNITTPEEILAYSNSTTSTATINVTGSLQALLAPEFRENMVVNIAKGSTWTGGFPQNYTGSTLTVNGPGTFNNDAATFNLIDPADANYWGALSRSAATINANVVGNGTFFVGEETMTFTKSVGAGQTVIDNGTLNVNDPKDFLATVDLFSTPTHPTTVPSLIDLMGLATADGYSYKNDMLNIYSGGKVIDTLKLHDSTQFGFDVVKTAGSVNVVAITDPTQAVTGLLPQIS